MPVKNKWEKIQFQKKVQSNSSQDNKVEEEKPNSYSYNNKKQKFGNDEKNRQGNQTEVENKVKFRGEAQQGEEDPIDQNGRQSSGWTYSNQKRTSDWDRYPKKERRNEQYSYDSDIQQRNWTQSTQQRPNFHQAGNQQRHKFYQEGFQQRPNFHQTGNMQRQNHYQGSSQQVPNYYQAGSQGRTSNYQEGHRGRENGFSRGYQRNFGNKRGIVRYVAKPFILYDQICQNQECQNPSSFVHHKDECPRLRQQRNQDTQNLQQEDQNKKQDF